MGRRLPRKTGPLALQTGDIPGYRSTCKPRARIKDYVSDDMTVLDDETEFGKGIMDFPEALAFLAALDKAEMWVLAEQADSAEGLAPEASISANHAFLQDILGQTAD